MTSYRLVGKDQYEQVQPGGELKHGTLGNETYTNKADTYGLMLSIDRRDVINDDLGAITTVPRKLGRGSGTEDKRRLLGDVPQELLVLHCRQQQLHYRCSYYPGNRRADGGRGGLHGSGRFGRQTDRHHAGHSAGAHGAERDGHAVVQVAGNPRHHGQHKIPDRQPAPREVPCGGESLPFEQPLHGLFRQGLVSAGRSERPSGDRGSVPQRPGVTDDRNGRGPTSRCWASRCVAITTSAWRCKTLVVA